MAQSYPYYIAAKIDAGQMQKLFRGKKYSCHSEAVSALVHWGSYHPVVFNKNQFVILEYTGAYQCKILSVYTNGDYTYVDKECSPEHF